MPAGGFAARSTAVSVVAGPVCVRPAPPVPNQESLHPLGPLPKPPVEEHTEYEVAYRDARMALQKRPWERNDLDMSYMDRLLLAIPMFRALPIGQRHSLGRVMVYRSFVDQAIITEQDTDTDSFHLIIAGTAECRLRWKEKKARPKQQQLGGGGGGDGAVFALSLDAPDSPTGQLSGGDVTASGASSPLTVATTARTPLPSSSLSGAAPPPGAGPNSVYSLLENITDATRREQKSKLDHLARRRNHKGECLSMSAGSLTELYGAVHKVGSGRCLISLFLSVFSLFRPPELRLTLCSPSTTI